MAKALPKLAKAKRLSWELYRDGITQGSLSVFLACPEQFRILYCEGWEQRELSYALEFGNYWHLACEIQNAHTAAKAWDKKVMNPSVSESVRREAQGGAMILPFLWDQWQAHFAEKNKALKWIAREDSFQEKFILPSDAGRFGMQAGSPIILRGKQDGVIEEGGGLWLHEMKTKGVVDQETLDTSLHLNLQTMLYMTVLKLLYPKQAIKGVIYDVIRRPSIKQGVKEPMGDYVERVKAEVRGEKYEMLTGKMTKGKGPSHYFMRWRHQLSPGDLERWQARVLQPSLYRLLQWVEHHNPNKDPWSNPHHYINPNALVGPYGPCAAYGAITANDYSDLKPRTYMYPELEAPL